jgi:hypothetical protein
LISLPGPLEKSGINGKVGILGHSKSNNQDIKASEYLPLPFPASSVGDPAL